MRGGEQQGGCGDLEKHGGEPDGTVLFVSEHPDADGVGCECVRVLATVGGG